VSPPLELLELLDDDELVVVDCPPFPPDPLDEDALDDDALDEELLAPVAPAPAEPPVPSNTNVG
jgi:hypothetical protein